jgi:Zn-dependent protease
MMFLPFLGAIALPRLPFETQSQAVFAALMGPGFSTILAIICAAPALWGGQIHPLVVFLGLLTVGINLFNMVPAEPLDGGIALRTIFHRLIGPWARYGLLAVGLVIIALGFLFSQIILVIFGGIAIIANIKDRKIDPGLDPMTSIQLTICAFSYVAMGSAYVTLYKFFTEQVENLPATGL